VAPDLISNTAKNEEALKGGQVLDAEDRARVVLPDCRGPVTTTE
jgi:hypothetical protein